MLTLLSYLLYFSLIVVGFRYSKSRVISILLFVYIWLMMGLNTYTPDYERYEYRFENAFLFFAGDNFEPEWGYMGLNLFFNMMGFSYPEFRFFFSALYALIAVFAARRLSKNPNFVLSFMLIWPFLPFVSGQRYTMASIIVCWGVPYLLEVGKKGVFKYIICLFIASTIHFSCWFYLIFILARKPFSKRQMTILFACIATLTLFFAFSSQVGAFTSLFQSSKVDMWLNKNSSDTDMGHLNFFGFLMSTSCVLIMVYVICKQGDKLLYGYKKNGLTWLNNYESRKIQLYKNIGILILFSIPGFAVAGEFSRYMSGVLPVFYALFSEFWFSQKMIQDSVRRRGLLAALFSIVWIMQAYLIGIKGHDVYATLTDNVLFK